ncbi:MAG: hypothetical protein CME70_14205 [Halobacteriovorax sp.]|nr:hypothetical protein [Halobacteriovorax sp.]|tara:strand:- start:299972 stop:300376 length:405 start_codon:yes stop_codon:yes gene_type:complete
MEYLKHITIVSSFLFFLLGCGTSKKSNPYRPSGKTKKVVTLENKSIKREVKVSFLRDRYNLCTHRRAIRSAKLEYNKLVSRENKYGINLNKEKLRYKKIILKIGERTKKELLIFKKRYNRPLYCSPEELRHLKI